MRRFTLLSVLLLGSAFAQAGDIYCEKDFHDCSDRPRPGALLRGSTAPRRPAEVAPAAPTSASSAAAASNSKADGKHVTGDPVAAQKAANAEHAAMQKDLSAKRAEQCKVAREKYQAAIDARRLYRTNAKGDREYLSDAESDAARLSARTTMDDVCGGK